LPTPKRDFLSDSLRESLQKLDDSASIWKPLGELDKVERIERQEVERKPESSPFNAFWTPAFAGVTKYERFERTSPE
jgi:hypothetical protein